MNDLAAPQIISADRIDNAVVVEFEDEPRPVVFPAALLYSLKDAAQALYEKELEDGKH